LGEHVKGTIKNLDPVGHGIIQADDGSKLPFLFIDALSLKILVLGQRVIFSVRRVQNSAFAENISSESSLQTGTAPT
jgi:cold shock CspA family protein